ncbi:MAG: protein kinase, partial [Anaerolineales bacterium]|nr:protein kinase [Anaerolineales bacterium]
ENLGVEVAVKENFFTSEDYTRQFHREATILASLRHPNLPRVTDHFTIEDQGQYLVMDFIEGEDLRERMDRVDLLSEDEVIVLGISICEALTYMHSRTQPVLHRDIKPGNVKITPSGDVVLVDFGLAKIVEGDGETTPGARAMTPGYSPPEQYGTARTDPRSDIYSLSATIYEALTGTVPEDALSRLMEQSRLTPVRILKPSISRKLAGVLERALEVRPEDRYQSAEEFKQALVNVTRGSARRRVVGGELTLQPPPNYQDLDTAIPRLTPDSKNPSGEVPIPVSRELAFGEAAGAPRKRRTSGFFMLAVVMGLAIGVCGGIYFFLPDVSSQAIAALFPSGSLGIAALNSPTPTPEAARTATPGPPTEVPTATPSLEPTRRATATPTLAEESFSNPEEQLLVAPPATETLTPTPTATQIGGGAGQLAFASDRTGIPQIWLSNLDGTNLEQITDIQEGACQPNWSPNGLELVFISPCGGHQEGYNNASLFIIKADGTDLRPLPTILGGDYDPAWSPNGDVIAFTSLRREGRPQVFFLNLEDLSVEPLTDEITNDFMPSW